jgi:riboflavin synthase
VFTGIVEELGSVKAIESLHDSVRLTIRGPLVISDAVLGDSICVSGVCLTVTALDEDSFSADVMAQTLTMSALGDLNLDSKVNLERALQAGARLGGHIVQGHVDGVGVISSRTHSENWDVVRIALPDSISRYVAARGSITVDGVSLTVSNVAADGTWFEISLIPTTLEVTTLGFKNAGDKVNLESDILARHIERLLQVSND